MHPIDGDAVDEAPLVGDELIQRGIAVGNPGEWRFRLGHATNVDTTAFVVGPCDDLKFSVRSYGPGCFEPSKQMSEMGTRN